MGKSILVVTHGMGKHTADSITETVKKAMTKALADLKKEANSQGGNVHFRDVDDYVEIVPLAYDDLFEAERKELIESGQPVSDYIQSKGQINSRLIQQVVNLGNSIGKDEFVNTHLLDVVLFATYMHDRICLRAAEVISGALANRKENQKFIILAHSLGTAVIHDTLGKLYQGGIENQQTGKVHRFYPFRDKISSLWMVANVSELLFRFNFFKKSLDPTESIVRPSDTDEGCVSFFGNVRHRLDPITLLHPFEPTKGDGWVPDDVFESHYEQIITEKLIDSYNPHDLFGYLTDPSVSYPFLRSVLPEGEFYMHPNIAQTLGEKLSQRADKDDMESQVDGLPSFDSLSGYLEMLKEAKDLWSNGEGS